MIWILRKLGNICFSLNGKCSKEGWAYTRLGRLSMVFWSKSWYLEEYHEGRIPGYKPRLIWRLLP
jgi:hypothetical protein